MLGLENREDIFYEGDAVVSALNKARGMSEEAANNWLEKADGNIISKVRYLIPINDGKLTAELDVFKGKFAGMLLVEVEFSSVEQADAFQKPDWFGEDVTYSKIYHNSYLSQIKG